MYSSLEQSVYIETAFLSNCKETELAVLRTILLNKTGTECVESFVNAAGLLWITIDDLHLKVRQWKHFERIFRNLPPSGETGRTVFKTMTNLIPL